MRTSTSVGAVSLGFILLTTASHVAGGGQTAADAAAPQGHWAYQPVQRPEPPSVRQESWVRSPFDRFILAQLEKQT